jgi:hypothetical protein
MSSVQLSRPRVQPSWQAIELVGRPETPGDDEIPIVFDGSPGPDLGQPIPPRPAKLADPGDVEPFISPEDCGFEPTPTQQAWWTSFTLTLAGTPGYHPDRFAPPEICFAWSNGQYAARKAIETDDAFDRGRRLGLVSEVLDIPDRFASHQVEAMTRGFAAGRKEFEEDRLAEAWADIEEDERREHAFLTRITDQDLWPLGSWT